MCFFPMFSNTFLEKAITIKLAHQRYPKRQHAFLPFSINRIRIYIFSHLIFREFPLVKPLKLMAIKNQCLHTFASGSWRREMNYLAEQLSISGNIKILRYVAESKLKCFTGYWCFFFYTEKTNSVWNKEQKV